MKISLGGIRASSDVGEFSPAQRSGLVLWLDSLRGVTQSAGVVSRWVDGSANGDDATPSPQGPTYTASDAAFGGQPSLTSAHGTGAQLDSALTISQPFTIYIVGKLSSVGAVRGLIDGDFPGAEVFFGDSGAGTWELYAGVALTGGTVDTNAHVFALAVNGASSAIYVDNHTTAVASGNVGTSGYTGVAIGGDPTYGSVSDAKEAAILIFSGVDTTAQRLQVMRYLGNRFGITVT